MAKSVLKMTSGPCIVKISGTNVTETVTLATDLLDPSDIVLGTPVVDISYAQWNVSSGATDTIKVVRNGIDVLNLYQNSGELDLSGNGGYSDWTENTSDLVFTIVGTGNLFLSLRKRSGYASKLETAEFSVYDDVNAVGS